MKRFLIFLSGARPEILAVSPTDSAKFEGLGGAVLTIGLLSALSMVFALDSALGVPVYFAVPLALVWGIVTMNLDRWLVSSMPVEGRGRFMLAAPRILLALLLSLVISTPLVLQIFKSEINAQIAVIHQRNASAFVTASRSDAIGQRIASLQQQRDSLQRIISSGGVLQVDPAADPQIISLTKSRDEQQARADQALHQWQCQLYGGSPCPNAQVGDGPVANAARDSYNSAHAQVQDLDAQIEARTKVLTDASAAAQSERLALAKAQLPKVQAQLDQALQQQSVRQSAFDARNQADNGLLVRLQALNEVAGNDGSLQSTRLLLFVFFMAIGCLPMLIALMRRPGTYDQVLALAQRSEFRQARDTFSGLRRERPVPAAPDLLLSEIWRRESEADAAPEADTASYEDAVLRGLQDDRDSAPEPSDLFADEDF